jgi:hypothetical protein
MPAPVRPAPLPCRGTVTRSRDGVPFRDRSIRVLRARVLPSDRDRCGVAQVSLCQ